LVDSEGLRVEQDTPLRTLLPVDGCGGGDVELVTPVTPVLAASEAASSHESAGNDATEPARGPKGPRLASAEGEELGGRPMAVQR
ncbi:MAG: hypothetical protein AAF805_11165, partial [Planctomycetota bacterium]